jgi:hypothetical protein
MQIRASTCLALLLGCGLAAADEQQRPQPSSPSIEQIYPQSWTVGQTVEVSVLGNFLDGALNVRFDSDALQASILQSSFGSARLRVSSAADARPGLYAGTLLTRRGLSNVFHFRVTGWKSLLEVEPNDRAEQATVVSPPVSLNGVIRDTADSDVYRFHASAGEVLAFNVLLGRNGYATGGEIGNLTLTLLDSSGAVLDSSFSRFLWDPYLQHKFAAAGDYFAVIDHSRLAVTCFVTECENRRLDESYQLLIGRSPVLWSVWPPAAARGAKLEASLRADFLPASSPVAFSRAGVTGKITGESGAGRKLAIEVAPDADTGVHLVSVPDASGALFPLAFVVTEAAVETESEPNDTLENSGALRIPSLVLGRMNHAGDVDSFRFQANDHEPLVFHISARVFGSEMLDPHVALLAADGDIVALNDDSPSFRNPRNRDSKLEVSIPTAPNCAKRSDRFYVQVRDNSKHFGESSFYLLQARKQEPSFEVGLASDRIAVEHGGTAEVPVTIRRLEGFADDVTVVAKNLPAGVSAKPLLIKAKETAAKLELTASDEAKEASVRLELAGISTIGGKEVSVAAVLPQPRMGDGIAYVQTENSQLDLSVVPPVAFSLERMRADARDDRVKFSVSANTPATVLVRIRKRPGFRAPIRFALEGLPPGVILEKQALTDEDRIAELTLRAAAGSRVPLGEYRVVAYGTAEANGNASTEATQAFYLRAEP